MDLAGMLARVPLDVLQHSSLRVAEPLHRAFRASVNQVPLANEAETSWLFMT